jgi:hypothetical protein
MVHLARAVCDDPVAALQHNDVLALITNGHCVGEEELAKLWA